MGTLMVKLDRGLPLSRGERLGYGFRDAADDIEAGRADRLDPGELADYMALGWLEGRGAGLRMTVVGACVYNELRRVWASRVGIGRSKARPETSSPQA